MPAGCQRGRGEDRGRVCTEKQGRAKHNASGEQEAGLDWAVRPAGGRVLERYVLS